MRALSLRLAAFAAFTAFVAAGVAAEEHHIEAFWNFGVFGAFTDTPVMRVVESQHVITSSLPFTVSALDRVNGGTQTMLTRTSEFPQPEYSGGGNACATVASAPSFSYASAAYFRWIVYPSESGTPFSITFTNCSFATRSTATGPKSWALCAFTNSVEMAWLGAGKIDSDSSYSFKSTPPTNLVLSAGSPVEFRLYGFDATAANSNGSANWRIDDLSLQIIHTGEIHSVSPVFPPELSSANPTTSSLTIQWDSEETATDGYLFDASRFPAFTETITPASSLINGSDDWFNEWSCYYTTTIGGTGGPGHPLTNDNHITSPFFEVPGAEGVSLTFNARTYNAVVGQSDEIHIDISTPDNPNWWIAIGVFTPTNNNFNANRASFDLTPRAGQTLRLRLTCPGSVYQSGTWRGTGVNNIRVFAAVDSYIAPYRDFAVATNDAPSVFIDGLAPDTTYYFRARSADTKGTISVCSPTLAAKTLDDSLAPVVLLPVTGLTSCAATPAWQGHDSATGFQFEAFRTNRTAAVSGPRVIITQTFKGFDQAKAVELTNIGSASADLTSFALRRNNGAGFGDTFPLSVGSLSNGAAWSLAPGASVLVIRASAAHDWLNTLPAIRLAALEFTDHNTVGLFQNGVHADTAPVNNYATHRRSPKVSSGRLSVDAAEWKRAAVPNGFEADYSGFGLLSHICEIPLFPTRVLNASQLESAIAGLRFSTTYCYRVRAVGAGSYSVWSDGEFTTLPPPKTTVVIVR